MNPHRFTVRLTAVIVAVGLIVGAFVVVLQNIQITQAAQQESRPKNTFTYTTRVVAARGQIVDRNGKVLAGNRASYNVTIINDVFFSAETPNENLRRIVNLCDTLGIVYADHFPVTMEKPFAYTTDQYSATWNGYFQKFLDYRGWDSDISAAQLIRNLRDRYHLSDEWSEEEIRKVISLRYELDLRRCTSLPTYVLLEDADAASLAALTELNIPGLSVEASSVREYYTDLAAHILGRTGPIPSADVDYYKGLGYSLDASVGVFGLEKAFESELRGTDGLRVTTVAADGTVLSEYYKTEPGIGNNVELTIDLDIQRVAEQGLAAYIEDLRANGLGTGSQAGMDVEGGSVVVMKIDTGEILACASYPTFSLADYYKDYTSLLEADYHPLINRALQSAYPPGSVFKMTTAIAGIDNEIIYPEYSIEDQGIYRRFESSGYTPACMLYTTRHLTHGSVNVMKALAVSCNYYFYEVGYLTGIGKIDAVAKALGLGEKTGVELSELSGYRANPETKALMFSDPDSRAWYGGDTIAAAIGQSEHRYTPIQLCSYIATLVNHGTRYRATFLRRVISADYQTLISQTQPEVLSRMQISDTAYNAYMEGMRQAVSASYGTLGAALRNYRIPVAGKTGTAQHGSGGSDHVSLVLYAPADDPQIAITIYIEKGSSASRIGTIAVPILDTYFGHVDRIDTVPGENELN